MRTLKENLKNNRLTIGSWLTIGHSVSAEIMTTCGFEWLTIDTEHSAIDIDQSQHLIQIIGMAGVTPLVRVGENNLTLIKRVMDAGAHGVIVPMIKDQADALRAVRAVRYPPYGERSVGLARAQGYGFAFDNYKKWLQKESVVIVQIEHFEAINNLEEILSVDGVDGSMIGPYDLSGSFGYPGEFDRPEVRKALRHYEDVCKKLKKPMGFHIVKPDPKTVIHYEEKGYVFLAVGVDMIYLGQKCREVIEDVTRGTIARPRRKQR